ncbi:MAG: chromosome partitioning protein ParB, partial [Pseudomonadota bacterium]
MNAKRKRLGRGLDALLSKPVSETGAVTGGRPEVTADGDGLRTIPVDLLQRGQYQPRVDMRQDSLQELAVSIKS